MLEKILESPLDSKEIKPVHPKGNQPWIFIGRADAEAEAPILWPHDTNSWLTGKDSAAGKDWTQQKKGTRMALPNQWTSVWISSGNSWWTGKSVMLQSIGLDMTEQLNWMESSQPRGQTHFSWSSYIAGRFLTTSLCGKSQA